MKKLVKWGAIGFGGFIVLVVVVAIFAGEPEEVGAPATAPVETPIPTVTPGPAPTPRATPEPTPTAAPTPTPGPLTAFGDGTWRVGIDIEPGTYRTDGTERCYWARLSGFTGSLGDLLANDNARGGPAIVTILPSDAGFISTRCGIWTK